VQTYAGTDRQCRGRLLGVVRDSEGAVPAARLHAAWSETEQRDRALASLLEDGLLVRVETDEPEPRYALP
jgi:A/G-specific adenine glycosylase